ncbi:uncharacterized protein LOC126907100 [Daktulosphaira vitifoliae]|uniref:uncharacterized protein LOC126907100 n=1 Tax=Daktulosphaira vitifoliae TaxID=58002 RepID=UPI0021AA36E7|nr:uncharacterized protein LOC126907100 [Daktulosphaira vitifoliae]
MDIQLVNIYSSEFKYVSSYFNGAPISSIYSVQNVFQYGRYLLRREMLKTSYEATVFHYIHHEDRDTAINFCCDFRRYNKTHEGYQDRKHPIFFSSFQDIIEFTRLPLNSISVLILKTLTNVLKSQCDYFIEYLIEFY